MLLVCISIYLKSFMRYTFVIFDTHHPDTPIYVSKDVRIRGYFLSQKGSAGKKKKVWETLPYTISRSPSWHRKKSCYVSSVT